jgi:hypothetical protein
MYKIYLKTVFAELQSQIKFLTRKYTFERMYNDAKKKHQ